MSKKSNFMWDSEGLDLPKVEAHTKARHRVTEDYLRDWIVTLCGNNMGSTKKITIIDGFCGGGMYLDENNDRYLGSPFRIIKSIEEGLRIVKEQKSKPNYILDAEFIFIDSKKEHIQCLQKTIKEEAPLLYRQNPDKFIFICDEFENKAEQIILDLRMKKCSSMFVLDPTGYTDVSMQTIRNIISLKKSEILYTFMIEYVSRFINMRVDTPLSNAFNKVLESEGYFDELDLSNLKSQAQQGYIRNETLRLFRNRGEACYVYSFALIPEQNQVQYYLVHLASNAPAQRVIKHSLWKHNNIDLLRQFRFGVYGLGFRSPDYYEMNLSLFNIEEGNTKASIECLGDILLPIVNTHSEGISFGTLHDSTMEYNPSTNKHYQEFINEQRSYGELEVLRDGKSTQAKQLKASDLIIRPRQTTLFDLKPFQK
jgi:three-Cys-motif partner protein